MHSPLNRRSTKFALVALSAALVALAAPAAGAATKTPATSATWTGKGVTAVGEGTYALDTEVCGIENGAPVDGPYVQFNLASVKGLVDPMIQFGSEDTPEAMVKSNPGKRGVGSYSTLWAPDAGPVDLAALLSLPVTVSWTNNATPVFTVDRGCIGDLPE